MKLKVSKAINEGKLLIDLPSNIHIDLPDHRLHIGEDDYGYKLLPLDPGESVVITITGVEKEEKREEGREGSI